ncbi:MAG: TlpA family protein disulfide reductase [Prevotella sp.]|nr:TlpA family protein disulfide reductase [Prevotella sp.]
MKKILLLLATVALATVANAQQVLHLTCDAKNSGDTIVVQTIDYQRNEFARVDTAISNNGTFTLDIPLEKAADAIICNIRNGGMLRVRLYLVPGEHLHIGGTWPWGQQGATNLTIGGSSFYEQLHEYNNAVNPIMNEVNPLNDKIKEMTAAGISRDSLSAFYNQAISGIFQKLYQKRMELIRQYPDRDPSATLVTELPSHMTQNAIALLTPRVRNGRMSAMIDNALAQADSKQKMAQAEKQMSKGKPAPDFKLKDLNGNERTLASFRGKYVLLDFWGSWCIWCIKGFPELKESYEKYKDRMEVVGIDCNDTDEKWRNAVKQYELPWTNLYNPKSGTSVITDYAVKGFPTKILISPDGLIHRVVVGEDPSLYTYLDELFK